MLLLLAMDTVNQVQNLDETAWISHDVNTLGKGRNPTTECLNIKVI